MPLSVVLMVLASAVCHAAWNVILKSQKDQFSGLFAQLAAVSVMAAAGAIWYGPPPRESWPWLAAGQVVHLCYHCFLAAAYKRGDVSLTYPIVRGAAPPLAAAAAFALFAETPALAAMLGIALVSGGILFMASEARGGGRGAAAGYALAASASVAAYSAIDAQGARLSGDATQYLFWLMMLDAVLFMPLALWRGHKAPGLSAGLWLRGAVAGALSVVAYGLALHAYTLAQIGPVAALRETSVIFGALFGMFLLGEKKSPVRFVAAAVIAIGGALVAAG